MLSRGIFILGKMRILVIKKEYLAMISEFLGALLIALLVSVCDKLVTKFYVIANPKDFS